MTVALSEGSAVVVSKRGFDPSEVPQALKKAGFSAGEIRVTATGVLVSEGGRLALKMPGPVRQVVFAGGARFNELRGKSELVGSRLHVTGRFQLRADGPPELTVDAWEAAGKGE